MTALSIILSIVALTLGVALVLIIGKLRRTNTHLIQAALSSQDREQDVHRLSIVAEHTADGVIICDAEGVILWANKAFFHMAGYASLDHMETRLGPIKSLLQLSTYPGIDAAFQAFAYDDEPVQYDSYHVTPAGKMVWTAGTLTPVYHKDRTLHRVVGIFTDITERKEREDRLSKYAQHVGESIRYARDIQRNVLPKDSILTNRFPNCFVIQLAKDVVSGDFRWFAPTPSGAFLVALADCTGHGVPGAFMSLLGNEFLHQIVQNKMVEGPEQALHLLDKMVNLALHQDSMESGIKDGMDIGMMVISNNLHCTFSGAFISLYILRGTELIVLEGSQESIGGFTARPKEFVSHETSLKPGDRVYMFTDGMQDLFGGNGKRKRKFSKRRILDLLLSSSHLTIQEQGGTLQDAIMEWKGNEPLTDDIMMIGIKV